MALRYSWILWRFFLALLLVCWKLPWYLKKIVVDKKKVNWLRLVRLSFVSKLVQFLKCLFDKHTLTNGTISLHVLTFSLQCYAVMVLVGFKKGNGMMYLKKLTNDSKLLLEILWIREYFSASACCPLLITILGVTLVPWLSHASW